MKLCIFRVSQSFPDLKADRTDTTPKPPKMGRPLKDPQKDTQGLKLICVNKESEKTIHNPQLDKAFSYGDYRSPTGNIYIKLSNILFSWQFFCCVVKSCITR